MKATLTFDLDDYHDRLEHKRAISATSAYLVILGIQDYIRNFKDEDSVPVDKLFRELECIIDNRGIDMNDLE